MSKEQIIEEIKNDPFKSLFKVGDVSLYEYANENYKPWTFKLTSDKGQIHESWFPDSDKTKATGDYFGVYPSLPMWRNEFFSVDDQMVDEKDLKFLENFPGTGGSLFVYKKA